MNTRINQLDWSNKAWGATILNPKVIAMLWLIMLSWCENNQVVPVKPISTAQTTLSKPPELSSFTKFAIKDGKFVANYETQTPEDAVDTKPSIVNSETVWKDGVKNSLEWLDVARRTDGTKTELVVSWNADKLEQATSVSIIVELDWWAKKAYKFVQNF